MNETQEYESRSQRAERAARDGETFEACRFGDRVSTCYHTPRCSREVPGFDRYLSAVPKPGMRFEHAQALNPDGGTDKARCTVTSVRHGRVYWTYTAAYDAGYRKGDWYFKLEDMDKSVGRRL